MVNALQLIIYLGMIKINYSANVQNLFESLLGFVNFDIINFDNINAKIFDLSQDHPINTHFDYFDIF